MDPATDHTRWNERAVKAHHAAAFHPPLEPGALPCIEVAGMAAFLYLDADLRAVVLSLHLEETAAWLHRKDHTVPLRVMINDTVVFDDTSPRSSTHAS